MSGTEKKAEENIVENKGMSLNDILAMTVEPKVQNTLGTIAQRESEKLSQAFHDSVMMNDGYSNSVMGLGDDAKLEQYDEYDFGTSTLNWYLWTALYNDSWVFKRVIDKPAQDMIRAGISINGRSDYTDVYKTLDGLKPDLIKLVQWGRLYGGSIMVLLFDGVSFEDMAEPMKDQYDKIKKAKVLKAYVTDRWFGVAPAYGDVVTNLANIDFGKPKYYDITFADGKSFRIHHSWLLRYENRTAPNFIKTGYLNGWGYSEGAHIFRELERDDKLKCSIQSLVDKALIEVFKMKGLKGVYAGLDQKIRDQLDKRVTAVQYARNNNSLTFIDSEDDYAQHNFSGLTGLSDILQQNMWQIAAAVEMQGVLFGDLSNGFSRDGDAFERYDETIMNLNEAYTRPIYEKLLHILYKKYEITDEISFTFNSIMPEKKNETRLNDIDRILDICSKMIKDKAMSPEQEANIIQEYLNSGQINFKFDKKNKNEFVAEKNIESETGDIDNVDEDGGNYNFSNMRLERKAKPSETNVPPREEQEPVEESGTSEELPENNEEPVE